MADNALYAIDEVNQRAFMSSSSGIKSSQDAYALKDFPYATPGSPKSKYFVQLMEGFPDIGCIYATYWKYGGSTFNGFPSHWWINETSFEIKNFVNFKYEMIKSPNSSVFEDYWYSNVSCKPSISKSRPCEEIYFRKGTDIPVRTTEVIFDGWEIRAYTRTYMIITLGKPDDKYFNDMPKDWARSCRDVTLGIIYDPPTTKVDLNQSVKVQVWLSTPPHRIDGNDTVHVQWKSTACTDCLIWKPERLSFNSDNFNEKQTLTITRVKDGPETTLIPIFNGGGFNQVLTKNYTIHIQ